MSDAAITAIATTVTAIIGAITSIIVTKIQAGKREESQSQNVGSAVWIWISGGIVVGAGIGFLIATFLLANPGSVIDSMDSMDRWISYKAQGNECQTVLVEGREKQAIEIIYYILPDGYVGISKILDSPPPEGTHEMILEYRGEGSSNMLEIKILYSPDNDGKSAVFSYDIEKATSTDGWKTITIPYTEFKCWTDTGCRESEVVAPSQIWKIDFAISSKSEGQAGVGTVSIDQITAR